jgi:hypothetical protein
MERKIISKRVYKAGYEIRTEDVWDFGCEKPIRMKSAYTPNGDYIGDSKTAFCLCKKRGIVPELAQESNNVCSIGLSEREQKWYGWSHRAIYGFSIDSKVELGDCGYVPDNVVELADRYREWNEDVRILNDSKIEICCNICEAIGENPDGSLILKHTEEKDCYKVEIGKGEWIAQTLSDAKQMAIDFAEGVS